MPTSTLVSCQTEFCELWKGPVAGKQSGGTVTTLKDVFRDGRGTQFSTNLSVRVFSMDVVEHYDS